MKKFLSYFPDNVYAQPPVWPTNDPPDREEQELLSIVPRERTRPYNMRRVVELIVDDGDYFEIQPEFATTVHTILARVGGYPVGIVANNPRMLAGAMTAASAGKQGHFIELCDHFHMPVVFLADVPGFMLGVQAERTGTLRHGMRAYWAMYMASVPVFTIITRKNFGMAGQATANSGALNYRVGWPSGDWGSIPIEGGVAAAYKREIAAAPDPDKRRKEIEDHLLQFRNPFRTAEAFGIEDIIDPRQTRSYIPSLPGNSPTRACRASSASCARGACARRPGARGGADASDSRARYPGHPPSRMEPTCPTPHAQPTGSPKSMNSICDAAWRSSSAARSASTASTQLGKLTVRERIDALADPGSFPRDRRPGGSRHLRGR